MRAADGLCNLLLKLCLSILYSIRGGLGTEATENDLLRRAFWCKSVAHCALAGKESDNLATRPSGLFILDAQLSISLGRAPLIALSTFDAPLPIQSSATAGEDLPLTALYQLVKLAQLLRTTASSLVRPEPKRSAMAPETVTG